MELTPTGVKPRMLRRFASSRKSRVMVGSLALLLGGCMHNLQKQDLMHVNCMNAPDPGPCKGAIPGFYYDYPSDSCRRFIYGGCGGQRPFDSMEACIKACGAKGKL